MRAQRTGRKREHTARTLPVHAALSLRGTARTATGNHSFARRRAGFPATGKQAGFERQKLSPLLPEAARREGTFPVSLLSCPSTLLGVCLTGKQTRGAGVCAVLTAHGEPERRPRRSKEGEGSKARATKNGAQRRAAKRQKRAGAWVGESEANAGRPRTTATYARQAPPRRLTGKDDCSATSDGAPLCAKHSKRRDGTA
ncbi:MAG: hypothetical protein RBT70_10115 [Alphaproteobacteria bacterium]|nr:hypothetical protein [Alphaproteobacteria bacterium]